MADEIARFQAEVQRLALDIAQTIFRQELELAPTRRSKRQAELPLPAPRPRKLKAAQASKRAPRAAERNAAPPTPGAPPHVDAQTTLPLEAAAAGAPEAAAAPAPAAPAQPAAPATTGRTRVSWTRESIINELATWMAGGTVIDAAFVRRHGPPGLVAATRRVFGRFEAGLNVAALHVSKLYPDGPPSSRSSGQP